jgi:hypothetical protein
MKTRLLKRLRRKARKEFPDDMILILAECKGYFGALKFVNEAMRNHILRRVADLRNDK